MTDPKQDFLNAEQQAKQLVEALDELLKEAVSYKDAGKELLAIREDLASLIVQIMENAKGVQDSIKLLSEIGAPEILGRLGDLEGDIGEISGTIQGEVKNLDASMTNTFVEIKTQLKSIGDNISGQLEKTQKVQMYLLAGIGVAIVISLVQIFMK